MKKLIIAISVLAVTGALASILLMLGLTSPEFVLAQAAKNAAAWSSVHVAGTVEGNHAAVFDWQQRVHITPNITEERAAALLNPKSRVTFEGDFSRSYLNPLIDARIVSGPPGEEPVRLQMRLVDLGFYRRFDAVPLAGRRAQPGYVGEWYQFGPSDFSSLFNMQPRLVSPEQDLAWRAVLADSRLFLPDGSISVQEVGGRKAWVIPVHLSAEGVADFHTREAQVLITDGSRATYNPQETDRTWHGTISVDRRTFQLVGVHLTNVAANASPGPYAQTMTLSFSRHNEPVDIAAPERSRFMSQFDPAAPSALSSAGSASAVPTAAERRAAALELASSTATSTAAGPDDDQDDDGLPDVLEEFYGSDAFDPDSDRDGVTDGAEVDAGTDPIGPGLLYDFVGGARTSP